MTSTPVIGIDADSCALAWSLWRNGKIESAGTIRRADAKGKIYPAYDSALATFMERAQAIRATVYAEGIFLAETKGRATPRNVQAFLKLAHVQAELLQAARVHRVRIECVSPNTWHAAILSFTTDRPRLKTAARDLAEMHLPNREISQHEADALCICLYGVSQHTNHFTPGAIRIAPPCSAPPPQNKRYCTSGKIPGRSGIDQEAAH